MCRFLKKIEIPPDSKLKEINKEAFRESSIENFTIPQHIKIIDEYVFSSTYYLKKVDVAENSEQMYPGANAKVLTYFNICFFIL